MEWQGGDQGMGRPTCKHRSSAVSYAIGIAHIMCCLFLLFLFIFFVIVYCLMSLNLNLSGLARRHSACVCVSICVLFQSISVLFVFRFWHFMQPLGVNMLIRAMYNTLSPLRETQNVFEMLINASVIRGRSANIRAT